jgi:HK97 gp10 family phage protein
MMRAEVSLKIDPSKLNAMLESVDQYLEYAATDCEKKIKKSITSGSKSGEQYTRNNTIHQASAPGEAPANDTGRLAGSVKAKKINKNHYQVDIAAEYALYLEFGTSTVQPRPFIIPAFLNVVKRLNRWLLNRRSAL